MAKLYFGTKKTKIIFFSVAGPIMLIIVGWAILTSWEGSPRDIVAVANQFKADRSWTFEGEDLTPPKLLCLAGSGHCPHIGRAWSTGKLIDHDQLQSILNSSGWHNVKIKYDDCYRKGADVSLHPPCSAYGTIDGIIEGKPGKYYIDIFTDSKDSASRTPTISFYITE